MCLPLVVLQFVKFLVSMMLMTVTCMEVLGILAPTFGVVLMHCCLKAFTYSFVPCSYCFVFARFIMFLFLFLSVTFFHLRSTLSSLPYARFVWFEALRSIYYLRGSMIFLCCSFSSFSVFFCFLLLYLLLSFWCY